MLRNRKSRKPIIEEGGTVSHGQFAINLTPVVDWHRPFLRGFKRGKICQRRYEVESVLENGQVVICFDGKWYRTIDDFFQKAELDDEPITTLYEELLDYKVVRAWN